MILFMLKATEDCRRKCVAFIEELLTGTVNFVELSTFYQPLKPFEGEGVGDKVPAVFTEPKPSQALLFLLHQLNALKVPLETSAWKY